MEKAEIRKTIKERFKDFKAEKEEEKIIIERINALDEYRKADTVLLYSALDDEVDLSALLSSEDKTFLFPYIKNGEMGFSTRPLKKGCFGIMEPENKEEYLFSKALLIAPGRAFTESGARLGRGKGFYDEYIRKNKDRLFTLGVCFSIQLFKTLPVDANDQKIDLIISGGEGTPAS